LSPTPRQQLAYRMRMLLIHGQLPPQAQ
jgi:hypothetical protein